MDPAAPPPEEGWRLAEVADLPRLSDLAAAAVAELRAGRGGDVWARTRGRTAPFEARFRSELDDLATVVVVGTLDGAVFGYGVARTEVLGDGTTLGIVDDLYSEPGARELAVGETMMDAMLAWCRDQGCFGVDSLALPGDRHTKNFFESFGLVARAIIVHKSLS